MAVPTRRERPPWLGLLSWDHEDFYDLLKSMYVAVDNDLRQLAAIAARTAFERTAEKLCVTSGSFRGMLDELVNLGEVSDRERTMLATLTQAGNAAAHRGWRPNVEQLDIALSIIEAFIHRVWVLNAAATKLDKEIPKRSK